ncbi:hypothetical protein HYH02_002124 [Chlamydomonas schloesseri]|uniref:Uncharacterized protein n=1 Tax=Chlamydomonas schloesseri TaxID=2026947 RepID=A0A836BBY3_9CHLO|nr:hypothetical protein HYH02_002124 [Chlamydomonas schloesseri]|eukprot:KAG2453921.1 hypothetical protein HYH02_002124 [Chlamydomonas schloesseri]
MPAMTRGRQRGLGRAQQLVALVSIFAALWLLSARAAPTAPVACPSPCAELWRLPRNTSGDLWASLNSAAGFNHSVLVFVSGGTDAALPEAQQVFRRDTLISSVGPYGSTELSPFGPSAALLPGLYLGDQPGGLVVEQNDTLTLQWLDIHNVLANFNTTDNTVSTSISNAGSPNGTWSFSIDSIEQQAGSWLRLVRSELVLLDCAVAQALWQAAGLPANQRPWGWNMTQGVAPEVTVWELQQPQLYMKEVVVTCSQVCGTSGVRTMEVATSGQWVQALQAVNQRSDGCSSYIIELGLPSVSLSAWAAAAASATAAGTALFPSGGSGGAAAAVAADSTGAWAATGSSVMSVAVPVAVSLNLTIRGVLGSSSTSSNTSTAPTAATAAGGGGGLLLPRVVLDAAYMLSVFEVVPPAVLTLQDVSLVRLASPRTGVLAAPLYFISSLILYCSACPVANFQHFDSMSPHTTPATLS